MRNDYIIVLMSMYMLLLCTSTTFGQQLLPTGYNTDFFSTEEKNKQLSYNRESFESTKFEKEYYVFIDFQSLPDEEALKALKGRGIQLLSYKKEHTYFAVIPQHLTESELHQLGICGLHKPQAINKMSVALSSKNYPEWATKEAGKIDVAIIFNKNIALKKINTLLYNYNAKILQTLDNGHIITARIKKEHAEQLAAMPIVQYIDVVEPPVERLNYENTQIQRVNVLQSNKIGGRNLTGKGVTIGVGDGGELGNHIDMECRVINEAQGTYNAYGAHGDHVTGTIGGCGNINPRSAGLAPNCKLVIQKTTNITYNSSAYNDEYGMVLTNNSYGVGADCSSNGSYNYSSINLDKQLLETPELLHVFAAGNSGNDQCGDYPQGFKTVLRYYGSAKNVLTVGAVDELRYIANLSSKGPVSDGRIKPEICGVGMNVLSTGRDYNYFQISGTSMAAPSVTASLGLLYERYRQLNNNETPDGGLIKAIACNTAEDLGNEGPDYMYGFGLINAKRAVEVIENRHFNKNNIGQEDEHLHMLNIPEGVAKVKVMLYWHDKEADVQAEKALVQDLDLRLINPNDNIFTPWVLDANPSKVDEPATRGIDHLNNIEQVTINNPIKGAYKILIKGTALPFGAQDYYLTYDFVKEGVTLTYPFGGESLRPNTKEMIQWDATSTNGHTFKVEYALEGNNWQLIADNIEADMRAWMWTVPSTITQQARIRVTQNNTNFTSTNQLPFYILNTPSQLKAESICEGYIELSWKGVDYAEGYQVYMLDCGEMMPIDITMDTKYLLQDNLVDEERYWFAVQAISSLGNKSERTEAVDCIFMPDINCPWNDGTVEYITTKLKGRNLTTDSLGQEAIQLYVKNIGNGLVDKPDFSYRINDEIVVLEPSDIVLDMGDEYLHTFAQKADFSEAGTYEVDAWINSMEDHHYQNDSVVGQLKAIQLFNEPIVLPYREYFQTATLATYGDDIIGLDGIDAWDFKTDWNATLSIDENEGERALRLWNDNPQLEEDALVLTLNMTAQDLDNGLYLSFDYKEVTSQANTTVWVRGSDTATWLLVENLESTENFTAMNAIDLASILKDAKQLLTTSFQLKFAHQGIVPFHLKKLRLDNEYSMPTTLMTFDAQRFNNWAFLTWETAIMQNENYFEIEVADEKAFLEDDFRKLAIVYTPSEVSNHYQYSFYDEEPQKSGIRYYRLKEINTLGEVTYSDIKTVSFVEAYLPIRTYPNPFYNEVNIEVESSMSQEAKFELIDAQGRRILHFENTLKEGRNTFLLGLDENLPKGIYILNVKGTKSCHSTKLTKLN